jgi:hypothetical protein
MHQDALMHHDTLISTVILSDLLSDIIFPGV